ETLLASVSKKSAEAVRRIFADLEHLEQYGFAVQEIARFEEDVWILAFDAVARRKHATVETLIMSWWRLMPPGLDRYSPLMLDRITQLWPEARLPDKRRYAEVSRDGPAHQEAPMPQTLHKDEDEPASEIDLDDGVFLNCAGVVLLHPFLPRLFEGLG